MTELQAVPLTPAQLLDVAEPFQKSYTQGEITGLIRAIADKATEVQLAADKLVLAELVAQAKAEERKLIAFWIESNLLIETLPHGSPSRQEITEALVHRLSKGESLNKEQADDR